MKNASKREQRPVRIWTAFALIVIVFVSLTIVYGRIIIDGDGLSYYALTLSAVRDHDFDLQNQKKELQGVMAPFNERTGKQASLFSCGFGVLYAPLLISAEHVAVLSSMQPYPQNHRIPFSHSFALFAGSFLFSLAALLLSCWLLVRKLSVPTWIAAVLCLSAFIGTPLLFYSVTMPSYAHAADAFLIALVFTLALSDWRSPWRNVFTGAALALAVLLRNNNIVFWPVAAGAVLWKARQAGGSFRSQAGKTLVSLLAGALPFLVLHGWFNLDQYGKLLTTGYRVQMEEGFLWEMLLHPDAGLYVWAPVTLLASIGLIGGCMQKRVEAVVSLAAVVLVFLSVQFQGNWWGGCSFGQRFFTHLFFFWVIGLGQFTGISRKALLGLAPACALWTFLLLNVYMVNAGTVEGRKMLSANRCRRTPVQLIASAESLYHASGVTSRFKYWKEALSARPYPTILFLGNAEFGMRNAE